MKIKHGISIEITQQLSEVAAITIAQWIGGYSVIKNQLTTAADSAYLEWLAAGKPEAGKPVANTQVAYLLKELEFLKETPSHLRRNAGAKWLEAVNAAKAGLRKRPKVKAKNKKRNCYVTNELFDVQALDKKRCLIQIKRDGNQTGKGNYLTGVVVPISAADIGKALYLSRRGRRFWLSISYDKELNVLPETKVKALLVSLTDEQLGDMLTGYDLGVKRQVTGSDNTVHHLKDEAIEKLAKIEAKKLRYQRKYARMALANDKLAGTKKRQRTNGERKLSAKIAKYSEKKANIQHQNSHRISKDIARDTPLCAVFEDLKIANMVRKPKAKQCPETGRWLRNGAKAKAGLNKAILSSNLGQIRQFAAYKLADQGKILIKVKPHYSSQECSQCGFTHKDNRTSQEKFNCLQCGFLANADDNASAVIKQRGIALIRSGMFLKEKTKRKTSARRKVPKAHELSSLGCGGDVSLAMLSATPEDALNSNLTAGNSGLIEAPCL